jgi:uncharacterized phage protein (TIGR01671 family)
MREIKFRVWSNEYNQYLTPYGYPNGHSDLWLRCEDGKIYDIQGSYEYDEGVKLDAVEIGKIIIEQYTGLKDKNGKEIYEGDKVELFGFSNNPYIVEFIEGAFCFTNILLDGYPIDINMVYGSTGPNVFVIGNIHEEGLK